MSQKKVIFSKLNKEQDKKIKNTITIVASIFFIFFIIKYSILTPSNYILDTLGSILLMTAFYIFYDKLHQDYLSYFLLAFTMVLHDFSLYSTSPFGMPFEHYIHFIGGFTVAIVADRLFNEKMRKSKRFLLLVLLALGIGAITEIVEWLGSIFLGIGEGLFYFGTGDIGNWNNSIMDMIFGAMGAMAMGFRVLFRKQR